MTLEEAIKHCEEKANENKAEATKIAREKKPFLEYARCKQCANDHEQLANWLKELKTLREVHGKVYRNEKCDRAGKCYDYIGYHCAGCNGAEMRGGAKCD